MSMSNLSSRTGFRFRSPALILGILEDDMPLPHFLILIFAVILAAGLTIWAASAVGVPLFALALIALMAAAIAHLATREDH
ncbi:MAG TPA: hypothetical protein VNQ78_19125 [Paracoccus sp. (in: a-proteobacteria)]|nr:hypothetical protein [Paracoccus sp. (in: a-proteobacteria)]